MADQISDHPTTLGNDYVQSTTSSEALFSDAYDFSPTSVSKNPTEFNVVATRSCRCADLSFAEESAYRIMKDIKAVDEARENQERFMGSHSPCGRCPACT